MTNNEEQDISAALVGWMQSQNIPAGQLSIVMLKMIAQGLGDKAVNLEQLVKLISEAHTIILNVALLSYLSED